MVPLLRKGEIDGLLVTAVVPVFVLVPVSGHVMPLLASEHMPIVADLMDVEKMANRMVENKVVLGYHLKQSSY